MPAAVSKAFAALHHDGEYTGKRTLRKDFLLQRNNKPKESVTVCCTALHVLPRGIGEQAGGSLATMRAPTMLAYTSDQFVLPLPAGHRFPMQKYGLLREGVAATLPSIRLHEAPVASDGELALAHTPSYVSAVAEGTLGDAAQREIGFPWTERMVQRSRRSVGATIAAARAALRRPRR